MTFQPLGKRVLVQRIEEENKTATGIIIPDSAKEKPLIGIVKAISHKVSQECKCFQVGDKVLFGKYKGDEIKLDGETYIVLDVEDLLGVLK
ncbi:co-chaperone GroES [Helicobacter sp. 11S02629-2]|nr:co-chaperone GroES [Helicobacter sp. 11S02629-2]